VTLHDSPAHGPIRVVSPPGAGVRPASHPLRRCSMYNTGPEGSAMATPGEGRIERRLAAILAADVAGYSLLTGMDEEGTHTLGSRAMCGRSSSPRSLSIVGGS